MEETTCANRRAGWSSTNRGLGGARSPRGLQGSNLAPAASNRFRNAPRNDKYLATAGLELLQAWQAAYVLSIVLLTQLCIDRWSYAHLYVNSS